MINNVWQDLNDYYNTEQGVKVHALKYLTFCIIGHFTSDNEDLNYIYQRWKYSNYGITIHPDDILEYDPEEDCLFCSKYKLYLNGLLPEEYFNVHQGCELETS